jgi:hypothetical protein
MSGLNIVSIGEVASAMKKMPHSSENILVVKLISITIYNGLIAANHTLKRDSY